MQTDRDPSSAWEKGKSAKRFLALLTTLTIVAWMVSVKALMFLLLHTQWGKGLPVSDFWKSFGVQTGTMLGAIGVYCWLLRRLTRLDRARRELEVSRKVCEACGYERSDEECCPECGNIHS